MKKSLFIAALATLALASCSKNEVIELQQDQIKFSAVADNTSRATEHNVSSLNNNGFAVWGYVHGTNTLHLGNTRNVGSGDAKASYKNYALASKSSDSNFDTDVTAYWPAAGVDIEAIYPIDSYKIFTDCVMKYNYDYDKVYTPEGELFSPGGYADRPSSIFFITVPTDINNQVDLLYATAINAQKSDNGGVIQLNFRHAMSQLKFNVGLQGDNLEAVVNSISFMNVDSHAHFEMPTESSKPYYNDDPYTETEPITGNSEEIPVEKEGYGWGEWMAARVNLDGKTDWVDYSISSPKTIRNIKINEDEVTSFDSDGLVSFSDESMFLIPQTAEFLGETSVLYETPNDPNKENIYLKVNCVINTVAADGKTRVKLFEGDLYRKINVVWKQGTKYVYNLKFGRESEKIRFSVTVDKYQTNTSDYNFIVQ